MSKQENLLQKRIINLVQTISQNMYEREELIAVALLGSLCGQNTFLYGPPGTAKSLISRRIASAFKDPNYFECLMNRFSTPEEVFGPVSIKALKEDKYIRKTNNYLPTAEFAFLDEIWKSSPAILNSFLTLINERTFRNGESIEKTPLKALIAASNETPSENQGLDALYDRFILRLMVGPICSKENFENLIQSKPTEASLTIPESLIVNSKEWDEWRKQIHDVQLSSETITIIHLIRKELKERSDKLKVYVSDRRWQRVSLLMKASAFFNGRVETNHSDIILLQHCLWTHNENREAVRDIVEASIVETGFNSNVSFAKLDREKESLEKEISSELFFSEDIYDVKKLKNKMYFYFTVTFKGNYNRTEEINLYVPQSKINTKGKFHPVDKSGNELSNVDADFDGQGSCKLTYQQHYYTDKPVTVTPTILFHRNTKKEEVNVRLVKSLSQSIAEIRENLSNALEQVEEKQAQYQTVLDSPFITQEKIDLILSGIIKQIEAIQLRIKDCERLEALCR